MCNLEGSTMKRLGFFIFITLVMGMTTSVMARFYSSASLQSLDDEALAWILGQDDSIQTATDPHRLYGYKTIEVLNQWVDREISGDLNQLSNIFYTNEQGATVFQINRDVVSIGILEFSLIINGLREMGNAIADQIKFD